ncbi:MAG: NAD(P)H-binding protein [Sphingobacteriaceae bacterium]|nr:NAD(P)H-binding protein [Cytophagaceae bacterium]
MSTKPIVVFGATGKVGSKVAKTLLSQGHSVRLVARDAARLQPFAEQGAVVIPALFSDTDRLNKALAGADVVLTMIPSNHLAPDFIGEQRQAADSQVAAIRASGIKNVLNLSSAGAHVPEGNGILQALAEMEVKLNELPRLNVLHLRPSYYLENAFYSLSLIKQKGINGLPIDGDRAFPMIATQDVAAVIAEKLVHFNVIGKAVLPLLGPRDYSLREFTTGLGTAIGRPDLPYVRFTPEDTKAGILASGGSERFADLYVELMVATDRGLLNFERRTPETTTPTTLSEFAERVFAPAYQAS